MKIAVIGSGLAGLTSSWLLSAQHAVTIYEAQAVLGMDAHSVPVQLSKDVSKKQRIDLPLRVFSEQYYQHLTKLYETTGIDFVPENYSGSLSDYDESTSSQHRWGKTFFAYGNILFAKLSLPLLFAPSLLLRCRTMAVLKDYFWFLRNGRRHLREGATQSLTFIQYLEKFKFSNEFIHSFIFPIVAGICTCSYDSVAAYPADVIIRYLIERSSGGVRRASNGTSDVVERLSRNCRVFINTSVKSVRYVEQSSGDTADEHSRSAEEGTHSAPSSNGHSSSSHSNDHARSQSQQPSSGCVVITDCHGKQETYDHVVIATQSNQCLRFLDNPTDLQARALGSVKYESSEVVLHTDEGFMPKSRSMWRGVNFSSSPSRNMPMATIWMNYVQPSMEANFDLFQTWNPFESPEESKVLGRGQFERPVVTFESLEGMRLLSKCQGHNNFWFCGSYVLDGMPLLENAVESAVNVCAALGCRPPWTIKKRIDVRAEGGAKHSSLFFVGKLFLLILMVVAVVALVGMIGAPSIRV